MALSEVLGCVDTEQGQAAGQHRPGGFGKREPGTVGGRGFLVAARQDGGKEGGDGIGDGDEVPGEAVGGAVRCGSGVKPRSAALRLRARVRAWA
ncbi:hypothetical protein ADK57_32475 [Streptomyces sp. MMG1533]|nr:hypothetical protein ADK57_32475 [Streptomyces sp. MMG1533]